MTADPASSAPSRPRIVIVGAGFAGFEAARGLIRSVGDSADVVLINPTNYFLYLPLLPEVAAGVLDPRRIAVSLAETLPGVQLVLGKVDSVDIESRTVHYTDAERDQGDIVYDRLVLAAGSTRRS